MCFFKFLFMRVCAIPLGGSILYIPCCTSKERLNPVCCKILIILTWQVYKDSHQISLSYSRNVKFWQEFGLVFKFHEMWLLRFFCNFTKICNISKTKLGLLSSFITLYKLYFYRRSQTSLHKLIMYFTENMCVSTVYNLTNVICLQYSK
jgi:hypothetical protein